MHRKKDIIYTTHCILNQNSVIREWERAPGAFNQIIKVILDNDISIIQLPCPEFTFLGEDRPPKTKKEYDTFAYRDLCKNLAISVVDQMKEYIKYEYRIIGLLGIEASPTCDTLGNKGIFMDELFKLMESNNINLKTFDIPEEYIEGEDKETVKKFYEFINSKQGRYI